MDCGWGVDMMYDSLYPGNLQSKFGVTQSFKNTRSARSTSPTHARPALYHLDTPLRDRDWIMVALGCIVKRGKGGWANY